MRARAWTIILAAGWASVAGASGLPADADSSNILAPGLAGQPEAQAEAATSDRFVDRLSFRIRGGGTFSGEADLDDGGGSVSVSRIGTDFTVTTRLNDRSAIALNAGAGFSFYDFENATGLIPSGEEPLDNAANYDFSALYTARLDDHWGIFIGGGVEFAPAGDASWDDSAMGRLAAGATYAISKDLRVGLGLAVASRLEDDVRVVPIPTITWQINEDWSLGTVSRTQDIQGLELSYRATENLDVFLLAGWASREYRLDGDGPAPDGVFRDDRAPVLAGVTWRISPQFTLSAAGGADAWTRYEVLDSSGDEIGEVDADPTLTGWVGLTVSF